MFKVNNLNLIGIDEVGRGSWSGPVVACAVKLKPEIFLNKSYLKIKDSKKVSKFNQKQIFKFIKNNSNSSFGISSVEEIDKFNILKATEFAIRRAFVYFSNCDLNVKIDGPKFFFLNNKTEFIIKGDEKLICISAASILAKVYRDKLMVDLSKDFPQYGWDTNAGYGTKKHIEAIKNFGVTKHHRKSFKPIKKINLLDR